MISIMILLGHHRQPIPAARMLCTLMIALILAQPVAAALPLATRCDGACCCCPAPDQDASLMIRGPRMNASGCCGSEGMAATCRMSSADRPDVLPALIRGTVRTPSDAGHLMPAPLHATERTLIESRPPLRADTAPPSLSARLYLRTCRLIC